MAIAPTDLDSIVKKHVLAVEAIDVHTHLLPSTHADLMLFGVDELLTYHYLVAELFMIMPLPSEGDSMVDDASTAPPSHDEFFAWPKSRQADLVFEELFVKRTPLSEACRGVITTLNELGLGELLRTARAAPFNAARLAPLREWFASRDPAEYLEHVFTHSKLKYAVMTNIPFVAAEAEHWLMEQPPFVSPRLKTALRVDPVLTGDWITISNALQRAELGGRRAYGRTLEGCRAYLLDWIQRIKPIYLMASTPSGFTYSSKKRSGKRMADGSDVSREQQKAVAEDQPPTAIELLELLLSVAMSEGLPIALKIGAVRGVNPALRTGGDGVECADLSWLRDLLFTYPSVKFLVTVLCDTNQHELCVLSRKFSNLHVYGCWWFCNNPSIIEKTTRMRLEMLGTAFTCQHSDARVLDQLLYKWKHSREAIAPVLANQYRRLMEAGWQVTEEEVERDVALLFGGAFEAFMDK